VRVGAQRIPNEDLTRQYRDIGIDILSAIQEVLPTGRYTLGPNVQQFEREWAGYCGTRFSLGISNGTEALHLALLACGVGSGDEVITACNTYSATAFAISYVGANPIFVDVDPITYCLTHDGVEGAITSRTRAVIPVHLYGQTADMDHIREMARRHGLWIIEDAAHAHGARYRDRRAGALGDIGCFSFYPTKVLGCFGDGGAVTTSDETLYEALRRLRYMGQRTKHLHEIIGYQQRLDEIQAAILRVKLRLLDRHIARRRQWAALYDELLTDLPVARPGLMPDSCHVYYLYVIRAQNRDRLSAYLDSRGIGTQIIYPALVPFQPAYAHLGYQRGAFPVAERATKEILCLPMFPELTENEVRYVAESVRAFYTG
jgi:dTDP-4-amino-4,6-dideoxygalactose transaminase